MTLLIFQTNIKSKQKLNALSPIFNAHNGILEWSIDQEDIDNVLRIEAHTNTTE